jgi:hypothetical protein
MTPIWEIERDLSAVGNRLDEVVKENDVDADLRRDIERVSSRIHDLAWKMHCNTREVKA